MADKLDIFNLTLGRLGLEAVADLEANDNSRKVIETLYDQVRMAVLEEFPWPFSIKRKTLDLDEGEIPDFEYTSAHTLPCDYITAISEFDDITFIREGEFILSNSKIIKLRYVSNIEDETKFSPLFVKVFYLTLAHEASYSLVQDKTLLGGLINELRNVTSLARVRASQESTPKDYEPNSFIDIRY